MIDTLRHFLAHSRFREAGAVMTDLDGTALHEVDGRATIPLEVTAGLMAVRTHVGPSILNTLRFPANVIRSFGPEWHAIHGGPLPLVSLNGGIGGIIDVTASGAMGFEEVFAEPLAAPQIEAVLDEIAAAIEAGSPDLLLFFHARDWRLGETLWTPQAGQIPALRLRFPHADRIISTGLEALRDELLSRDLCLLLLPHGDLPIFQQQQRRDFITGGGADKLSGALRMAAVLDVDLAASIGAGDTAMDVFLQGCGLAIRVGAPGLAYSGLLGSIDVADSAEFGSAMASLAGLLEAR